MTTNLGTLGTFEYEVLSVLQQEPTDAYGASIRRRLNARTGRDTSEGSLYTALERLEAKGFVASWWGGKTPERGGRRKRYYRIMAPGEQAILLTDKRHQQSSGSGGPMPYETLHVEPETANAVREWQRRLGERRRETLSISASLDLAIEVANKVLDMPTVLSRTRRRIRPIERTNDDDS